MSKALKADLFLVIVSLIWGATFPLVKDGVSHISPEQFVYLRFLLAAICFLPLVLTTLKQSSAKMLWGGFVLGSMNAGVYVFQSIGLEHLSSARSAFITGVNVIVVPFLLPFFRLGKPGPLDIVCTFICVIGLYILTGANLSHFQQGDGWTLVCAILSALTIVYLQKISTQINSPKLLAFYQILFTIPIAYMTAPSLDISQFNSSIVVIALLYCAILATCVVFYLQTRFQRDTTATHAALIYTLEPIFAAMFGYVINGEHITSNVLVGGGIILSSILLAELLKIRINRR